MIGVIIGDVCGSGYGNFIPSSTNFLLVRRNATFSEKTIRAIAIAQAFIQNNGLCYSDVLKEWYRKYPYSLQYSSQAYQNWVFSDNSAPLVNYYDCSVLAGLSIVALSKLSIFSSLNHTRFCIQCSHNNPLLLWHGINYMLMIRRLHKWGDKKVVLRLLEDCYGKRWYKKFSKENIDNEYFDVLPTVVDIFYSSHSFEEAIKYAILANKGSIIPCLVGGLSEAYFGVPDVLWGNVRKKLPLDILSFINKFSKEKGEYNGKC